LSRGPGCSYASRRWECHWHPVALLGFKNLDPQRTHCQFRATGRNVHNRGRTTHSPQLSTRAAFGQSTHRFLEWRDARRRDDYPSLNPIASRRSGLNGYFAVNNAVGKIGSNLGPITPKYHTKWWCERYAEPRKSNEIAFLGLSSKQRVGSSSLPGRAICSLPLYPGQKFRRGSGESAIPGPRVLESAGGREAEPFELRDFPQGAEAAQVVGLLRWVSFR